MKPEPNARPGKFGAPLRPRSSKKWRSSLSRADSGGSETVCLSLTKLIPAGVSSSSAAALSGLWIADTLTTAGMISCTNGAKLVIVTRPALDGTAQEFASGGAQPNAPNASPSETAAPNATPPRGRTSARTTRASLMMLSSICATITEMGVGWVNVDHRERA